MIEVAAVYMRIYTKQTTKYGAHGVLGNGTPYSMDVFSAKLWNKKKGGRRTDLVWEDSLVIEQALCPAHQGVDVFWSR
jgi:hypothetical protein